MKMESISRLSSGMNSSSTRHTHESSQSSVKFIDCAQQYFCQVQSLVNGQTDASHPPMHSSLCQINLHSDQRLNQQKIDDDPFQILLQSMNDVSNSSEQIPLDSPGYMSILNELTGGSLDNAAVDPDASSHDKHNHGEPTLD